MKQSLREAYQDFYKHNRQSRSTSPSTGRVHHKRHDSFGPTVCLISKNPENDTGDINNKLHILMLILQIQRLNRIVATLLKVENGVKVVQDGGYLKKQVNQLKKQLQQIQTQKYQLNQQHHRTISSQTNKLTEIQSQLKSSTRKNTELKDQVSTLQHKIRYMQEDLQRAKVSASRMSMNALMTSQTELRKSILRDKPTSDMQVWKQKLTKYENMINQQKQFINNQKFTIDKLHNSQLEIKQRFEYQISMFKKNNQDLMQKCQSYERQIMIRTQTLGAETNREINQKQRELEQVKDKISQILKENQQLKANFEEISKRKSETTEEMRNVINELRDGLEELNADYIELNNTHDKCKIQISQLRRENQFLRGEIQNLQRSLNSQINDLQMELSNKDQKVSRLQKQAKKGKLQNRIQKSYSETHFKQNPTIKNSLDLKDIIQDVMELQNSNLRMNNLIQTKSRSQITYASRSYQNYGL